MMRGRGGFLIQGVLRCAVIHCAGGGLMYCLLGIPGLTPLACLPFLPYLLPAMLVPASTLAGRACLHPSGPYLPPH